MFKKFSSEEVSAQNQVKASVQRKIKQSIAEEYPGLEPVLDDLLPKKSPLIVVKCQNHLNLVVVNNVPLFFNIRDGPYMPTLRLLHQYPNIMKKLQVDRGAIKFAEPLVGNMWASMSSWFTPTILFCVLNLMIGTIFLTSNFKSHHRHHPPTPDGEHHPPQLVRAPSILERVRSINFSLYRSEQPETHHADPPPEEAESRVHHVTRSKSDTTSEAPPARESPAKMRKSESENSIVEEVVRRRAEGAAASGEEEGVDAKADDFINRFKQQLKLQRLESLLRYRDMLNRGSGR